MGCIIFVQYEVEWIFSKSNGYVLEKYLVKSKIKEASSLASVEH